MFLSTHGTVTITLPKFLNSSLNFFPSKSEQLFLSKNMFLPKVFSEHIGCSFEPLPKIYRSKSKNFPLFSISGKKIKNHLLPKLFLWTRRKEFWYKQFLSNIVITVLRASLFAHKCAYFFQFFSNCIQSHLPTVYGK